MRKEILNGTPIPYELSIKELTVMLSSPDIKQFSLACEALSYKDEIEAYNALKAHLNDKDKYRRLCVLKVIFRHGVAAELVGVLENAIASGDFLFVRNGLEVAYEYGIAVDGELILAACKRWLPDLNTELCALGVVEATKGHYEEIVSLFKRAGRSEQKEYIADVLVKAYLVTKHDELYRLFCGDSFAKIRLTAARIALEYGYDMASFLTDEDGHVRSFAQRYI